MVKIMMIARYPPHKLDELIKNYTSSNKPAYPDYLKKVEHWAAQVTDEKHKTYAVYECPEDKIMDGLAALTKRFTFYAKIEGYTFKSELLAEADEALKMMLGK